MKLKKFIQTSSTYLEDSDEIDSDGYYETIKVDNIQLLEKIVEFVRRDTTDEQIEIYIDNYGFENLVEYYQEELYDYFS